MPWSPAADHRLDIRLFRPLCADRERGPGLPDGAPDGVPDGERV